jgi:hypothetical protein
VGSGLKFGLFEDLGTKLCRQDVQEHAASHHVSALKLATVHLEELVPPINASSNVFELPAAAVLAQTLSACVLDDLSFAMVVSVETSPHREAVAFFLLAACELRTP